MRWLIIYLVIIAIVWLFVQNRMWRRSLLALSTAAFVVAMVILAFIQENEEVADTTTAEQFNTVREQERIEFGAIAVSEIAIGKTALNNQQKTVFDSQGRETKQADPFTWQLSTSLTNRSEKFAAKSINLQLNLYSCPAFFSTPQSDMTPEVLTANCALIGKRSFDHGNKAIEPGKAFSVEQTITFPTQTEPRNPRYWLSVQSVKAIAAKP